MKKFFLLAVPLILFACTHVDTGQIDYRVADAPGAATEQNMKGSPCSGNASEECGPTRLSRVQRRYDPGTDFTAFTSQDVYSIEIEQGMIGNNILEGHILGRQMGHNAEIAILANVFEFAAENSDAATLAARRFLEFSAADDPSDVELKLIYFSDDVNRNQPFNFSNIPLRQRSRYGGGSIGIQIVIMEIDAQSGPMASLMGTLARFGQQVVPGPTEVKDLLFDLGESLFTGGGNDDRLFEYRFVLSAPGATPISPQATFAPGRYVLRRGQERSVPMEWGDVRLDHNTARLYRNRGATWEEIRDELYLVLNIRRYDRSTLPELYQHQRWTQFRQALEEAGAADAGPIASVTANIQQALVARRSDQRRSDLAQQWAAVERHLSIYTSRALKGLEAPELSQCAAAASGLRGRRDSAERDARDAIREFLAAYQGALRTPPPATNAPAPAPNAPPAEPEFKIADREALVSFVARYFMPWAAPETSQNFASATVFEGAFVNGGDLAALAIETAQARSATISNCQDLASRGG